VILVGNPSLHLLGFRFSKNVAFVEIKNSNLLLCIRRMIKSVTNIGYNSYNIITYKISYSICHLSFDILLCVITITRNGVNSRG